MNKELIKKYKEEFDYWLNNGSILWRSPRVVGLTNEWLDTAAGTCDSDKLFTDDDTEFVINDKYVEFRIALTDGKEIEYYVDGFAGWQKVKDFNNPVQGAVNYRIKPTPKIEIGDWIIIDDPATMKYICKYSKETYKIFKDNLDCIKLWEPKPTEWYWFWNGNMSIPVLRQFVRKDKDMYDTTICKSSPAKIASFDNCEPFIGTLPTRLKDQL